MGVVVVEEEELQRIVNCRIVESKIVKVKSQKFKCVFKYLSLNISLENLLEPVNVSYVCVDKTRNVYPCIFVFFSCECCVYL